MVGEITQTAVRRQAFGRRSGPPSGNPLFARLATPTAASQVRPALTLDTKRVIARSFSLMGRNGVTFLALVAAAAVPERLAYHLLPENPATLAFAFLLTFVTCVPLYGAVLSGALWDMAGKPVSFTTCFRAGLRMPSSAVLLSLLVVGMVWFLLIIPGMGLATGLAVAAPAALAEGKSIRAAMAQSGALTAPYRAHVRVLLLMLAALAFSRALPMLPIWGILSQAVLIFMFGNWLFPLLLTAFTAAASAALYQELCLAEAELPPMIA
jgi:hypothetical protein